MEECSVYMTLICFKTFPPLSQGQWMFVVHLNRWSQTRGYHIKLFFKPQLDLSSHHANLVTFYWIKSVTLFIGLLPSLLDTHQHDRLSYWLFLKQLCGLPSHLK